MFTEQFSQHGFKVQSACVNLEVLRTAQKGESMSVIARRLLLEVWVPQRVTSRSSSPSTSAPPSSPSSSSPSLHSLDSSMGQAMLISLLMSLSSQWPQGSAGSDPWSLLCVPPCSPSSPNGLFAAFDYARHTATSGPLHGLISLTYSPTHSHSPSSSPCSNISFSGRLTLTILFNTGPFSLPHTPNPATLLYFSSTELSF